MSDIEPSQGIPREAAPTELGASGLLELGASLGSRAERSSYPGAKDHEVARSLCVAAIEREDEAGVEALLRDFNFFPVVSGAHGSGLIEQSAKSPSACGFVALVKAAAQDRLRRAAAIAKEVNPSSSGARQKSEIGFLREGLLNTLEQARAYASHRGLLGERQVGPVHAALTQDSALALAKTLAEPGWREALAQMEPDGVENRDELSLEELASVVEAGSFQEKTLLRQALIHDAARCASLLLALPEFSQNALLDRIPRAESVAVEQKNASLLMLNAIFKKQGRDPQESDPEDELRLKPWGDSFLSALLPKVFGNKEADLWERCARQAIDAMDFKKSRPQLGTDRGWAEIIAFQAPAEGVGLARSRALIERVAARGGAVDWARVSALYARKKSPPAIALAEWAALLQVSPGRGAIGTVPTRSL